MESSFSSVYTLSQNRATLTRILLHPVSHLSKHCHKTELHSQDFCCIQFLICLHTVTKQSFIHKNSAASSFSSVCTRSQNRVTFTRILLHPVSHLSAHCHKTELHSQDFCCIQCLICLHTVTKQSFIHKNSAASSVSSVYILSQNRASFTRILLHPVSHLSTHCHKTELYSQEFCCIQFLVCLHCHKTELCYLWLFTIYINIKIGKNSC